MKKRCGVVVVSSLALASAASATINVIDLGTGAPPASFGGFTLVPFGDDTRPTLVDVTDVSVADGAPFGGITFSPALNHRQIGDGWATWSHGYAGDVYYTVGGLSALIGLPANTGAFYFYAEPNQFSIFNLTATAQDGTSLTVPVSGLSGANGFGFYTSGGMPLVSITVTSDSDFAIGEFGIAAIPSPSAGVLALAGLGMIARRRR